MKIFERIAKLVTEINEEKIRSYNNSKDNILKFDDYILRAKLTVLNYRKDL